MQIIELLLITDPKEKEGWPIVDSSSTKWSFIHKVVNCQW